MFPDGDSLGGWRTGRTKELEPDALPTSGLDIKTARNILTCKATRVDLDAVGRLADALGVDPGQLRARTVGIKDRWAAARRLPIQTDD